MEHAPKTDNRTATLPVPEKTVILAQANGEEAAVEQVEVAVAPPPSPRRSSSPEKGTKMPTKPISEQVVSMTVDREQDDHLSESTKAERLPVAELSVTNDSRLAEVNPAVVAREPADYEVEAEVEEEDAVVAGARVRHTFGTTLSFPHRVKLFVQDSHEMDLEPDRFDPIVAKSPVKVYSWIPSFSPDSR